MCCCYAVEVPSAESHQAGVVCGAGGLVGSSLAGGQLGAEGKRGTALHGGDAVLAGPWHVAAAGLPGGLARNGERGALRGGCGGVVLWARLVRASTASILPPAATAAYPPASALLSGTIVLGTTLLGAFCHEGSVLLYRGITQR